MRLPATIQAFVKDEGGFAAEFALVLPLLLLFVLGTIDIGLYSWRLNQAEKATQIGARWAIVTNPVVPELATISMVNSTVAGSTVAQGDRIPKMNFDITCDDSGCTCAGSDCGTLGTISRDGTAFDSVAGRIQDIAPFAEDGDIEIVYSGSGLGFAGDPNGPDIVPFVTVRINDVEYSPLTLFVFGGTVDLGDFSYTMTLEDASGTSSN
ncbi:hypothetical protein AMC99_01567 [Altererythrobacter epoxidivorans]|uniref:TadE-like domain-containing protein n=1 Tax=Altererythrobacter epoxidivorans TaxID=361183 RepID=A0A0M4LVJ5_9SPHN|nr:TadE/TadG family type IV pilus assembly protein [Altererythrobacter epoxidivorans]ALE16859.1 hypothetical protein AMC99_01567 [Altererythrobacter epoxidivorans]